MEKILDKLRSDGGSSAQLSNALDRGGSVQHGLSLAGGVHSFVNISACRIILRSSAPIFGSPLK